MEQVNRRVFLASAGAMAAMGSVGALAAGATAAPTGAPAQQEAGEHTAVPDGVVWRDVRDWGVEGKAFSDTERYFDRLPARAKGVVREAVWKLSKNTAGMSVRFEAETPAVYLKYELTSATLAMSHMPASGTSGFDLYTRQGSGDWCWMATRRPSDVRFEGSLVTGIRPGVRTYQLNLPLYNGVKSLEIGLPAAAAFKAIAPRTEKPVLFYGTSITQGGCASRPGLAFVSILGRRLDRPMLNFGFSGNGHLELEVGRFLAELDPAVFVIDCLGNCTVAQITGRTEPLVRLIRQRHESTPILLLDRPVFPNAGSVSHGDEDSAQLNAAQHKAYERLLSAGVGRLYYRDNRDFIGTDGEGTVDGTHPNDLGMMRYADALEAVIRKVLAAQ